MTVEQGLPPADRSLPDHRRSVVLETVVRLAYHTVIVLGVFLLFRGHNQPGGGFVGGLVVGAALVLRYVSGGPHELVHALPVDPALLLGGGLTVAGGTGLASWVFGGQFLESAIVTLHPPVLGEIKIVSAQLFDIGVFVVVVGLVLALLRTLGDTHEAEDPDPDAGDQDDAEVPV